MKHELGDLNNIWIENLLKMGTFMDYNLGGFIITILIVLSATSGSEFIININTNVKTHSTEVTAAGKTQRQNMRQEVKL